MLRVLLVARLVLAFISPQHLALRPKELIIMFEFIKRLFGKKKKVAPVGERYGCLICGKTTKTKRGMNMHLTRMHDNIYD